MKKHVGLAAASIAALCLLSSFAARADDQTRPLTREEVIAQVLAARQSGELVAIESGSTWKAPEAPQPAAEVSRDKIVADVLAARQSGELVAIESGGSWSHETQPAPVSREKVIADFMKTRAVSDALAMENSL